MVRDLTQHDPLPLGELLRRTLTIYLKHLVPFLLLGIVVFSPWLALSWLRQTPLVEVDLELLQAQHGLGPIIDELARQIPWNCALLALRSILTLLFSGLVSLCVVREIRGQAASVRSSVAQGWRSIGTLLPTSIVGGMRITVGFVLCLIPGIFETCRLFGLLPPA